MAKAIDSLVEKTPFYDKWLALGAILLYAGFSIAYGFMADGTWDDDCVVRYYNVQNAFNEPRHFISLWNRPLFTLIFFLPVHLGKYSILFGMVLISCASAWALYRSCKLLNLKHAWLVVAFFAMQTFFFGISRNALTEPLSVAILSLGLLFYLRKQWLWFAVVGSLLPLARLELSVLLIFWVIPLLKEKQIKYVILLGVPTLLFNIVGGIMWTNIKEESWDPLWLVTQTFGADNESNRYGHTTFGHYFQRYIYVLGPVVFYFFLLGLLDRVLKRKFNGYILGQFAAGFMLYVIFSAFLNMGNAAGFLRNLAPLTPLAAVLAMYGYNTWLNGIGVKGALAEAPENEPEPAVEEPAEEESNVVEDKKMTARQKRHMSNQARKKAELEKRMAEQKKVAAKKKTSKGNNGKYWLLFYTAIVVLLTYTLFSYVLSGHHKLLDGAKEGEEAEYLYTNLYVILGISALLLVLVAMHWKKAVSYTTGTIVSVLVLIGCASFTFITEPPDNHMNPERTTLGEVSDMYVDSYLEEFPLYCNHSWFFWANDLEFYPEDYETKRLVTIENLENAPDSSIIIWENHYASRLAGDVPMNWFEGKKQFVLLYRTMSSDNQIVLTMYQKIGKDSLNAIAYQNKFIENFPEEASGYFARGSYKMQSGDMQGGLDDLTIAVEKDTAFTDAFFNRGIAYFNQAQYRPAINDFIRCTELKSDHFQYYFNIGAAYANLNNPDSALIYYVECAKLKEDHWEAYANIGNIYFQKQDWTNAAAFYGKALEFKPDLVQASANRARCLTNLQDWQNAIGEFTRLSNLQPNDANAFYNLGYAHSQLGKNQEACPYFQRALALGHPQAQAAVNQVCF